MKLLYFDCFSGISGDMVLGALVDAGCDIAAIEKGLLGLGVSGWRISSERVMKNGLSATRVHVETSEHHHHRGLATILELISKANLPERVGERASRIFRKLGEAEAQVHNVPVEKVHFHEVGAVDAIVDIVGACIGFELLGIERFACSALNVGGGTVKAAHGILPVPAPATALLLHGAPTYSSGVERELVTPTGAAIVAALAEECGAQPRMTVAAAGYGAGSADLPGQPNVLRVFVGEADEARAGIRADDEVSVIEANLDDMNPQIYGYFVERALGAGALDVFTAPVQMKKGRPGTLLTLLCKPADTDRMMDLLFAETTTIGARTHTARRRTLARESVSVQTSLGAVRMKLSRMNGHVLNAAPEYEDCQRIAAEKQVPLKRVLSEAMLEFEKQRGKAN
jgi:pyridinium-3,5-bisthiocarboxylic acid mononucleotide nickel chelatase